MSTLQQIVRTGMRTGGRDWYEGPHMLTLLGYMLSNDLCGFPGPDSDAALRLTIEACGVGVELVYDVSDLVWSQYFTQDDDLVAYALGLSVEDLQSTAKIIILTEGRSDAQILSTSLDLLHPHLADYYSFLDFDAMRLTGGAGNLANLVKAFAAAGVANKVIALFDNDTAGVAALRALGAIDLPQHILPMKLPDLELLRAYPTVGPSGCVDLDVNGLAASVELYLGSDVLMDDGKLLPIQWTGYERTLGCYQGEVLDKGPIQERFRKKLERARSGTLEPSDPEWDGLRAIFEEVFAAFHELDIGRNVEALRAYYSAD